MESIMTEEFDQGSYLKKWGINQRLLIWGFVIIVFVYVGFKNYLLFHTSSELFSIVIAFMIFIIAIKSQKYELLILGVSYGFIAGFDLLHTLAYKGMGVFTGYDANLPTQLWVIGRYMESVSFLLIGYFYNKRYNIRKVIYIYGLVSIFLLMLVFRWDLFPVYFIEGVGLTPFKKLSELTICGILALAIGRLVIIRLQMEQRIFKYLVISLLLTIASEVSFIFYTDVYGIANMIGHIFKLLSFYFIYKSIVVVALLMPYEELYQKERENNRFIQLLPQAIFVLEQDRIVFANKSADKLLGLSAHKEIKDKSIFNFLTTLNESDNQLLTGEQRIKTIYGLEIEVDVLRSPYTYNDKPADIVVLHDLTEVNNVNRLTIELAKEGKKLEELIEYDRIKTVFFSNISHELKTPLNVILGTIQLMELYNNSKVGDENNPIELEKRLKTMKQNCYRLLRLINNLIDLTKIDSGYLKIELINQNIVSVVEDIALSVSDYITNKGIRLVFDTEVEEKIIACNPDSIERIILNLLSNAIKFTNPGGEIFVDIIDGSEYITISVKDTGIGIPKEKFSIIFERFMQVDQSLTRNSEGTGIGLSLVKSLVEMHGGSVVVFSQEGEGTEFVIKLPVLILEEEKAKKVNKSKQSKTERISIEFSDIYSIM